MYSVDSMHYKIGQIREISMGIPNICWFLDKKKTRSGERAFHGCNRG